VAASRSAFQRKSHATGEGQRLALTFVRRVQSKLLPLTCRCFLALRLGRHPLPL